MTSAPAHLAFGELEGVFHHPTDAVQAAALHVFAGPGDHLADRVKVRHVSPGGLCGQRSGARVGEQVQHLGNGQAVGLVDAAEAGCFPVDEFPVRGLFGEYPDMLESGQPQPEAQVQVRKGAAIGIGGSAIEHPPLVIHLFDLVPCAAVLLAGFAESGARFEIHMCKFPPLGFGQRRVPKGLGLRTAQHIFAEPLQFLTPPAVEQLVVFPVFCRVLYRHLFIISDL